MFILEYTTSKKEKFTENYEERDIADKRAIDLIVNENAAAVRITQDGQTLLYLTQNERATLIQK